jgi:hypothetical protein
MKKVWLRFKYVIILACIGVTGSCCYLIGSSVLTLDMRESTVRTIDNTYTIDPNTILDNLENGKSDVFTLQTTPNNNLRETPTKDQWAQMDFLLVTQELNKFAQQESLSDWHLNEMHFMTDCKNASYGLESGIFDYYRTEENSPDSRLNLTFYVEPMLGQVELVETKSTPDLDKLEPLDVNGFKISVEEVIQIAEDNGGFTKRTQINNECYISARIKGGGTYYKGFAYDGWVISYISPTTNHDSSFEFYIKVDSQTGEYKIIDREKGYPNLWQVLFPPAPE